MDHLDELNESLTREFVRFICGERLGSGVARTCYRHAHDSELVIKIEDRAGNFQNIAEWQTWQAWKEDKEVAKWLAPCAFISDCGSFLVQRYARNLLPEEAPKQVPGWVTDMKLTNMGKIGKQIVCRDYGHIVYTLKTKMRKWDPHE